eukprot:2377797-Prymnesium_polylepis.2
MGGALFFFLLGGQASYSPAHTHSRPLTATRQLLTYHCPSRPQPLTVAHIPLPFKTTAAHSSLLSYSHIALPFTSQFAPQLLSHSVALHDHSSLLSYSHIALPSTTSATHPATVLTALFVVFSSAATGGPRSPRERRTAHPPVGEEPKPF